MKYFSVAVEIGNSFCGICILLFSVLLSVWVAVSAHVVQVPLIGKGRLILLLIEKNDLPSQ